MDSQTLINLVGTAILAVLGWGTNEMWSTLKAQAKDIARLREEIPMRYVSKDDFKDSIKHITDLLESIRDKLDNKADK